MTYAFLVLLAVSSIVCAVFAALWRGAVATVTTERANTEKVRRELSAVDTALDISEASRGDERRRLEAIIAHLKLEIFTLENDLAACSNPTVVRERLRRLLSGEQTDQA